MKGICYALGLALSAALLLANCGDKGNATPQAAAEFAEAQNELGTLAQEEVMEEEEQAEWNSLIQHFSRTADARYATPAHKLTMLHLACMLKKPELARCLLKDGADPHARTICDSGEPGDTPLSYAVASIYSPETSAETVNLLLDTLLDAGADLKAPAPMDTPLASAMLITCYHEEVFLHLLHRGMPTDESTTWGVAFKGWNKALRELLDNGRPMDPALLPATASLGHRLFQGQQLLCARLLLERGVPVDSEDAYGRTALFIAASCLRELSGDGRQDEALEMLCLLLSHGADAFHSAEQDEEYPGFCAYDFLAEYPEVLEKLKEAGYPLHAPKLQLRSGPSLLGDVSRIAMRPLAPEEIAPHFETIASVLTPSPAMQSMEIYPEALCSAIALLARVDAVRAARAIEAMPFWKDSRAWVHHPVTEALVSTLQRTSSLVLDKDFLISLADKMEQAGLHDEAAAVTSLLGRCPHASAEIDIMCNRPEWPLQAGAWQAKLIQAGLPPATDGSVSAWLANAGRQADTPVLKRALLLTSLEQIWYGEMDENALEEFLSACHAIGAHQAAEQYKAIAQHLDDPDKLDEIMSGNNEWKFELEIATARYFLQHREELLPPPGFHG